MSAARVVLHNRNHRVERGEKANHEKTKQNAKPCNPQGTQVVHANISRLERGGAASNAVQERREVLHSPPPSPGGGADHSRSHPPHTLTSFISDQRSTRLKLHRHFGGQSTWVYCAIFAIFSAVVTRVFLTTHPSCLLKKNATSQPSHLPPSEYRARGVLPNPFQHASCPSPSSSPSLLTDGPFRNRILSDHLTASFPHRSLRHLFLAIPSMPGVRQPLSPTVESKRTRAVVMMVWLYP